MRISDWSSNVFSSDLWHGINLDKITSEIHRSNMSKLGADGKPIINECKHYGGDKKPTLMTGVEAIPATMAQCHNRMQFNKCDDPNHLIDPTKPIGKILKGPNYTPPQLGRSEEHTSELQSLLHISY